MTIVKPNKILKSLGFIFAILIFVSMLDFILYKSGVLKTFLGLTNYSTIQILLFLAAYIAFMALVGWIVKDFGKGVKQFGEMIANIVNFVLLSIVYIFGVGVTSIVAKIFNKKFLDTKIDKEAKTYWKELNLTKKDFNTYYRQF